MRVLLSWLLLIAVETLHGVLRGLFLMPVVGELRARQIGVPVGCIIVLGVAMATVGWMGRRTGGAWLRVGLLWTALTLGFEYLIGWLQGFSWERMIADYDLTRGGFMGFGLLVLIAAPYLAARWRGLVN